MIGVPPGTQVERWDGTRYDLVAPGQEVTLARGGIGGRGNKRFTSAVRQAPRLAERGLEGEEGAVELHLKLLADVGLVGLPNAGKSSLIARLTRAQPKIAGYPFTTLEPNLGTIEAADRQLVIADIPGLIEGASGGAGLGHDFLAHVERTRAARPRARPRAARRLRPGRQPRRDRARARRARPAAGRAAARPRAREGRPRRARGRRGGGARSGASASARGRAAATSTRLRARARDLERHAPGPRRARARAAAPRPGRRARRRRRGRGRAGRVQGVPARPRDASSRSSASRPAASGSSASPSTA